MSINLKPLIAALIKSKIGKLEFPSGYPTEKTAQMLED